MKGPQWAAERAGSSALHQEAWSASGATGPPQEAWRAEGRTGTQERLNATAFSVQRAEKVSILSTVSVATPVPEGL